MTRPRIRQVIVCVGLVAGLLSGSAEDCAGTPPPPRTAKPSRIAPDPRPQVSPQRGSFLLQVKWQGARIQIAYTAPGDADQLFPGAASGQWEHLVADTGQPVLLTVAPWDRKVAPNIMSCAIYDANNRFVDWEQSGNGHALTCRANVG